MLNIAICDDNISDLEVAKKLALDYLQEHNITEYKISAFNNAMELEQVLKSEQVRFDLALLDVVMPLIDGIQIGAIINSVSPITKIIYFSTSREFALDSYTVNAYYYLLKPIIKENFNRVLDKFFNSYKINEQKFIYIRTSTSILKIEVETIQYAYAQNRHAFIVLDTDEIIQSVTMRKSFLEYMNDLFSSPDFAICSISDIINIRYVAKLSSENVIMHNGKEFLISRKYKDDLQLKFFDFFAK